MKGCGDAKIIVISDPNGKGESVVTLEESVVPAHLEDDHSAAQLVERLGWAILDAEHAEFGDLDRDASLNHTVRPQRSIRKLPRLSEQGVAA